MADSRPGPRPAGARGRSPAQVEPAPRCLPGVRVPVTIYFRGANRGFVCKVVRVDAKARQVLLAMPDGGREIAMSRSKSQAAIGWADHSVWHESRTTATFKPGSRYCWVRITSGPVHRERRRFVRARQVRPISIHSGRHSVSATTMDMSEAALRVVTGLHEPIYSGNKVHVVFKTHHRFRGEVVPIAIDGHVFRTRELDGHDAGRKEVVILYENIKPAEVDFIRGLVFDVHLRENKPALTR